MRTIRASEVGGFLYCQRAWWYRQQGFEPENQAELAAGSQMHDHHGRAVLVSGLARALAFGLLLLALVLLTIYLAQRYL